MLVWKRGMRRGKPFFLTVLVLMLSISTVSFTFRFYTFDSNHHSVKMIEKSITDISATLKIESIRQYKMQKILTIINRYNKRMPHDVKLAVADEICKMSLKYSNLDIDLICATITHESARSWNPEIVSFAGAMGLMQIMPATGVFLSQDEGIKWTEPEAILFDPILNIRLGCRYLSNLIKAYDVDGGLAAYNGGEERAALWLKHNRKDGILWEETRGYVPAVLKLYKKYQKENGIL